MNNFYLDNEDLLFYTQTYIDWDRIFALTEAMTSEDAPETVEEAKEIYTDIMSMVGEFAANEIAPHSAELDRQGVNFSNGEVTFPPRLQQISDGLAELGLHGLCIPRELGGSNCPLLVYMVNAEIIGRADVSVMTHHGFHGGMAAAMLMYSIEEGTTEFDPDTREIQSTRFQEAIGEIIEGKAWGCMDITEPNAGSDMAALRVRGVLSEEGDWRITGQKIFVTSGHGKYHFVIARTEDTDDLMGLSLFLVKTYEDGPDGRKHLVEIERVEEKIGHHASATVTVNFNDTSAQLIGKRGGGFRLMLMLMNGARVGVGFESIGLCESALRLAKSYASTRVSMGKTIDQHELIADMLDEMRTDIQGLRALAMRAVVNEEIYQRLRLEISAAEHAGEEVSTEQREEANRIRWRSRLATPLLKYLAAEKAVEMARRSLQIHGGSGYTTEYGAEKLLRDALVLPIYEGTSQIQALMATKDALLHIAKSPAKFSLKLATMWRKSLFAADSLDRKVATIKHLSLKAQRQLIMRVATDKFASARKQNDTTLKEALSDWDPKRDFGPALLHAEHLTRILADSAICDTLHSQSKQYPERREVLARYLERALPRARYYASLIEQTGERILSDLSCEEVA